MATVMLGLAPLEELHAAAAEGARLYLLGTLATVVGLVVVWSLRKRPLVAALLLLGWQGAIFWPLHARTTSLGLAFHGEYVLHHFTGLVAAATAIAVASHWLRTRSLGPARIVPAGLALVGTLSLVLAHVVEQPSMGGHTWPWLERAGAGSLLLAWGTAIFTLWRSLGPAPLRWVALALWVPLVVRVAFAWPEGLGGASVSDGGRMVLMVALVIAGLTTFALFRPVLAPPLRVLVIAFCGVATIFLYYFYRHGFGELEAGLGGLAQSMFAFSLPYPTYVVAWEVWLVMLGLFALFASAYGGLVSPGQRVRGIALALIIVAGLGLSTPPLVLMTGAAGLLFIDSLLGAGEAASESRPPLLPMDELLTATAKALGTGELLTLEDGRRTVLAVRGELDDVPLDIRARPAGTGRWNLTIVVGVLGRGRPPLTLAPEPGDEGHRPAHLIGRTHRAHGQIRQLELIDDPLFEALLPFASAKVELWDAGTRVRLGRDLAGLDDTTLVALVRELAARP